MNADDIKFRCSSLGHLMTEPRSKSEVLSETTKTHLIDVFVSNKYGRKTDIQNKYITKGLEVEEDSLTIYSRYKKQFYVKNEKHFENSYIKGTPDIVTDKVIDIKSSYDIFTFFRNIGKLNKMYYWQLQGYMALTGTHEAVLAYCLTDTPDALINDEKRRLMWKMGALTEESPDYKEACEELERLLTYPDIPLEERVIEQTFTRNDDDINRLYNRIEHSRAWMNKELFYKQK